MSKITYANLVGSLMYVMACTRPDLAYPISMVSRFMENPGKIHWLALKCLMRYIRSSLDLGLSYGCQDFQSAVAGYVVDADFVACLDTRKSFLGYVVQLFGGGAVSWKASLQRVVALSTTEAEYVSADEGIKGLWLKGLIGEMGISDNNVVVFCDNQSALFLMMNPAYHDRTKHIDIKLHFVREKVSQGLIKVEKVARSEELPVIKIQPACFLSKETPRLIFPQSSRLTAPIVGAEW